MIAIIIKNPVPPMTTPTVIPLIPVDGFSESETKYFMFSVACGLVITWRLTISE